MREHILARWEGWGSETLFQEREPTAGSQGVCSEQPSSGKLDEELDILTLNKIPKKGGCDHCS